jgi:hypothetical protein
MASNGLSMRIARNRAAWAKSIPVRGHAAPVEIPPDDHPAKSCARE